MLHINAWWIYLIGLIYTIIDKEVPYLPTPKENEWNTNYKIIIPNLSVAFLSIFAVIYGLYIDLTPYSLVMAGFALFNACIMFFGIYLTHRVTNQNRILRENIDPKGRIILWKTKKIFYKTAHKTFITTRKIAWPLLLGVLIFSMNYKVVNEKSKWENLKAPEFEKVTNRYLGIFDPDDESGLTNIRKVFFIENQQDMDFDIISFYLAWNEESIQNFPRDQINGTYSLNAIPMITWEPWASTLPGEDKPADLQNEKKVFKYIEEGYFDSYIRKFAAELSSFEKPIFLRFAHEFDNPQYPWSQKGDNTPEEFIAAWRHVYNLLKAEGAHNAIFVWNPWKDEDMEEYFPGDNYVDWIGITLLNYGPFNHDGKQHSFRDLYSRFHEKIKTFTRKPVMLAEFGSVRLDPSQDKWVMDAINTITTDYDEIGAVVLFNSAYDKNIPKNDWYSQVETIDWTLDSISILSNSLKRKPVGPMSAISNKNVDTHNLEPLQVKTGVRYNKGKDWMDNYYALTRKELNKDLAAIKKHGISTIFYPGGNIYDYNFLSQTRDLDLKIVYQFNLDHSQSYLEVSKVLKETKTSIIKKIKSLKEQKHVVALSFTYDLENYYHKPLLHYERSAFINWLNVLFKDIRNIDTSKHLIVELPAGMELNYHIKELKTKLTADAVGLIVEDEVQMERANNIIENEEFPTFLSSVPSGIFVDQIKSVKTKNIILENWQDERITNQLSLNGLVDFKGRRKEDLHLIDYYLKDKGDSRKTIKTSVLRPATLLYPGESFDYHALVFQKGRWEPASAYDKMELEFEWYLVKLDDYGNRLAIKEIGNGPAVNLEIPENYKLYEILLVTKNISLDYVVVRISPLHTPAP